ncbi:MAG TPA: 3-oxoacyl-ACP reductase [Lentisphaeria bacterium]|nr:3-oxoacyl-ACP reductase [Lentisphaeria bacterium]|tara:strand:- start:6405 stop:7199 length:795 start_codon:yes stop_codon:yes gene_type:complete
MTHNANEKVVFVTGAASGLGKATTERFLRDGYKAVAIDVAGDALDACVKEWDEADRVLACQADVRNRDEIQNAVDATVKRWGSIDVLVNNAGIAHENHFLDITPEVWQDIIDINLTGIFNVAQLVARQMVKQESGGVISNMSSRAGISGEVKYAHYSASKAGVILLTKTMAIDLADYNIRVNAVAPGYIRTELPESLDSPEFMDFYAKRIVPMNRLGTPDDVAGVFAFLASDDARFMTGATLLVDGGQDCGGGRKLGDFPPSNA